jgi:hypothetical protein
MLNNYFINNSIESNLQLLEKLGQDQVVMPKSSSWKGLFGSDFTICRPKVGELLNFK